MSPSKQPVVNSVKVGCTFSIQFSGHPQKKKQGVDRIWLPVRITGLNLAHGENCNPSVGDLQLAKAKAGKVYSHIDLRKLREFVKLIAQGATARHIRTMLADHIDEAYVIDAGAICNIRARALKIYLEDKELDKDSIQKLVTFKPLDQKESIILADSDIRRDKLNKLMREVLRSSDTAWMAKEFLAMLKQNSPAFITAFTMKIASVRCRLDDWHNVEELDSLWKHVFSGCYEA